ncbi:MAG: Gx transporter family protein [Actinomycetia bacterium]|nr:Gx transporter family protein [Actinomycetes bacterium]
MDSTLSRDRALALRAPAGTRRLVKAGVLLAGASVLGLLEAAIASPIPGVRFGLANIAVMVALVSLGEGPALTVSLLRVGVVGLATGSLLGPTSLLAISGALASWAAMSVALRSRVGFSLVGVSIAGATAHVAAQFAAAALMTGAAGVVLIAPPALLASLPFGIATGFAARLVISRLEGSARTGR